MGMYNGIIDDELLNALGIYKERLSRGALYAEMLTVGEEETAGGAAVVERPGYDLFTGKDEATELTDEQLRQQFAMYIAALRISDDFGLDAVGIQYQQGLKDLVAASDIPEGLLNNPDRPPVRSRDGSRILWDGQALPNFNEVDEGVAVDALVTNRVWTAMGLDPSTTLHDVRWGEDFDGHFVWVFEISGSVPASHFANGYASATSMRQSPVYFPLGGGTLRGVSKPGEIVWSRLYVVNGALHYDIGRGTRRRTSGGGDRAAVAGHKLRVADHARRAGRSDPGPVHGPAQGQSRAGRLCPRCRAGRPGPAGQGRCFRPARGGRAPVRRRQAPGDGVELAPAPRLSWPRR